MRKLVEGGRLVTKQIGRVCYRYCSRLRRAE